MKRPDARLRLRCEIMQPRLRYTAAARNVQRGRRAVDLAAAMVYIIRQVQYMVIVRVGRKGRAQALKAKLPDHAIRSRGVGGEPAEQKLPDAWAGRVAVKQDLIRAVIKQQHSRAEIGDFHSLHPLFLIKHKNRSKHKLLAPTWWRWGELNPRPKVF